MMWTCTDLLEVSPWVLACEAQLGVVVLEEGEGVAVTWERGRAERDG
jgi:hypothetical protein